MKHHYGWIIILLGALVVACTHDRQKTDKDIIHTAHMQAGEGITITGSGTWADPFVISVNPFAPDNYKVDTGRKYIFDASDFGIDDNTITIDTTKITK